MVVTTHGSSKWINAVEGEGGKRVVTRSLRAMCNRWTRTKWIALYDVDRATETERQRFLRRVAHARTCADLHRGCAQQLRPDTGIRSRP